LSDTTTLPRHTNQARGLARYAIDFLHGGGKPSSLALAKVEQFHLDSIACAVAALATGMNAPCILREEAREYAVADASAGAPLLASTELVSPEKAVLANSAAARELDANGTNFGFNPTTGDQAGEFGHNDFYPVALAAAQMQGWDGRQTLLAMLCLDEIRGRLAEVFALKNYKIDHVVHGAIASAIVYAAIHGGTEEQIESAIGLTVAHYIPFRAIRAGHQLSDSKGASAAISSEAAVIAARRALRGFVGPADIFRNPQAIFRLFEPTANDEESPFDLHLSTAGDDFAVMQMHFKLGLYEHQSAGAIAGLIDLLAAHPQLLSDAAAIESLRITIYEPAFGIIGDPAKRDPQTRQSADHSMVYIIATLLRKALEQQQAGWETLMLTPTDYDDDNLSHPVTRALMQRIEFVHGGPDYDRRYPDGIPTTVEITHQSLGQLSSGLVMYPEGHARNTSGHLNTLLKTKFERLAGLGVSDVQSLMQRFTGIEQKSPDEIRQLLDFTITPAAAYTNQ